MRRGLASFVATTVPHPFGSAIIAGARIGHDRVMTQDAGLTATLPDMRANAAAFALRWASERRERAEKDTFWNEFFEIFGVSRRRVGAVFEYVARRYSTGNTGFVDLLWPRHIGVEHKSQGEDLDEAMDQLVDYLPGVSDLDLPRLLVVCDFQNFVVRDIDSGAETRFTLAELSSRVEVFAFLAGHSRTTSFAAEEEANLRATALLAKIHDELLTFRYPVHDTRVLLVRLLYCLFADDTGVWTHRLFEDFIDVKTASNGSDLGLRINELFELLDTDEDDRLLNLDATLREFPYVNGGLFSERLRSWSGNEAVRRALLDACGFQWSKISPVIFGSLFQNVMTAPERRSLGAHFTSERDIMRVIRPLFLDQLEADLERAKTATSGRLNRLREFHDKIAALRFLDPAAGVGNFLLLTYRELRRLELEALLAMREADPRWHPTAQVTDIESLVRVTPGQFFGIELEEFPARIGETAMQLVDHVANVAVGAAFGRYFVKLPIAATAHIAVANALTLDWAEVLDPAECSYVLGNPPFVGLSLRSAEQTAELKAVWGDGYHGSLDYVTGWYRKFISYSREHSIPMALVSTNSITQGEQVAPLWDAIDVAGYSIAFAHQTFAWRSEARGPAKVHVIIVGIARSAPSKLLYEYANVNSEPEVRTVANINPYLVEVETGPVHGRSKPLTQWLPEVRYGNKPTDDGNLIIEAADVATFRADPVAAKYVRRFMGARELLYDEERWCLWLNDLEPGDLGRSTLLRSRVDAVTAFRATSKAAATRDYNRPTMFRQVSQPAAAYLGIPIHVSVEREYYPSGYFGPEVIASNANFIAPDPDGLAFAVISSSMFITWQRVVGGRIKSDLRFNKLLSWNTMPLPALTSTQRNDLIGAGQAVLDARAAYPDASLASLYERNGIPQPLLEAHRALDRVVDKLVAGRLRTATEADRLRALFIRFKQLTTDGQLAVPTAASRSRTRRAGSSASASG